MEDVKAVTRIEAILNGEDITPVTREEAILSGADVEPLSREEYFVQKRLGEGGGGGGVEISTTTMTIKVVRGTFVGGFTLQTPFARYDMMASPAFRTDSSAIITSQSTVNHTILDVIYPSRAQLSINNGSYRFSVSEAVNCSVSATGIANITGSNPSVTLTVNTND